MKNLTFVIQGPVFDNDIAALSAVVSIRKFFPESPIVVSTWGKNDEITYLSDNLVVVHNCELPNRSYSGEPWAANFHRQVRTVVSGLDNVNTDFACKLRTDCYFTNSSLQNLFESFVESEKEYLQVEKLIRFPFYNYGCDWFQIGTTAEMRRLWSRLEQEKINLNFYDKFPKHGYDPLSNFYANFHPEQMVYMSQFGVRYSGRDYKPTMNEYIEQRYYYKEKVLLVGKHNIGLESTKYPNKKLDIYPSFLNYHVPFFLKLIIEILIGKLICFR